MHALGLVFEYSEYYLQCEWPCGMIRESWGECAYDVESNIFIGGDVWPSTRSSTD